MAVFPEFSFPFNDLDDGNFNLAIYEMQNGPVRYDADRLASLSFNPLLHNIRGNLFHSFDLDPDTSLNDLSSDACEYFTEHQFNNMLTTEDPRIHDSFSLLHLNIRSLQCNANKLTDLFSNVNFKFSLIGISETWLNDSSPSVDIDSYSFVHKGRENRSGGGVSLYVSIEGRVFVFLDSIINCLVIIFHPNL